MTQVIDPQPTATTPETDLVAEVQRVLSASPEPLTLSKIRTSLRGPFRATRPEDLAECLRRQVAANVVLVYPRYRSQHDRYWDRPMTVHIASLLREVLAGGPLAWSDVRRKLPAYAQGQAEAVLQEQLTQGQLYRHPRQGGRGKDRIGLEPPDPREYLRAELSALFGRLEQLGFSQAQLRASAMELLHDEEWASAPRQAHSAREETGVAAEARATSPESPGPETRPAPAETSSTPAPTEVPETAGGPPAGQW
jgi:hypothetical protein